MKKYLLLSVFMMFICTIGFSQSGAPTLDINWEMIPTPGASALSFAEKDGRMWIANGRLYFSDDEGLNWQEHPDLLGNNDLSYRQVFATDNGITVLQRSNSGSSTLFSDDNGNTFNPGGLGFEVTTEPDGSGYSGPYGFFQKSANEIIGIKHTTDELFGENFLVVGLLDSSQVTEEYFHASSGYVNNHEFSQDEKYFSIHNDTIAALSYNEWTTDNKYKLELSHELDTTFTMELIPPNDFSFNFNKADRFWYQSGKVYLYHQDSFLLVTANLGIDWEVIPSPTGDFVHHRNVQFTERGIHWNMTSGLWVTPYDDYSNSEFIFDFKTINTNTYHSGDYNLYSAGDGIFLQSSTIQEPELRDNGIQGSIQSFNAFGQVWWVRANNVLFRSTDEGVTWQRETSPIAMSETFFLEVFADFGDLLYAFHENLVYVSTDNGINWTTISNQLIDNELVVSKTNDEIYLYNNDHLLFSEDGVIFSERVHPSSGSKFFTIENKLYGLGSNQRYISENKGMTWGPPEPIYGKKSNPQLFHTGQLWSENELFYPTKNITVSNDAGKTWIEHVRLSTVFNPDDWTSTWLYFAFATPEIAFMNGPGVLFATANLGGDWGKITGPNTTQDRPFGAKIKGEYLFGSNDEGILHRAPLGDILAQLSDTVLIQNQISGFLYKDDNNNCTLDETDRPIKDKVITLGDRTTTTDETGWYGVFHASIDTIEYYTDSLRHHDHNCEYSYAGIKLISSENLDTLSIGFHPKPGITDGGLSVLPMGIFRPDGTPLLKVKVTNFGTEDFTNQPLNINFNSDQQGISGASSGMLFNNTTWQFSVDLLAGEEQDYWLEFLLDQDLSVNDTLFYQVEIPISNDAYPADNTLFLEIPVLSSFDPNDKTVFPATKPLPGETTELVYRIRFQNTGTDTAFNVTVIDTLSENLNLYSLRMLEVSHPYDLQIDQGNIVRWNFRDILLPDSTTNEPESHGFIYFKIDTKNNLIDGDLIPNLAAIYFDFNEPILTNKVVTEIKDILISTEDLSDLPFKTKVQPNPTSLSTQLIFELENPEKLEMILFNEIGQQVQIVLASQVLGIGEHQVEWSMEALPSGIYFLKIENDSKIRTVRVVKME